MTGPKFRMMSAQESGIGGFPLFFALTQIVSLGGNLRAIAYAAIWLLYWRSSERVRLTFTPGSGMTEIPTPT